MILKLLTVIFVAAIFVALVGLILTIWSYKNDWEDVNKNIVQLNHELENINNNMETFMAKVNTFTKKLF